jgi:hypothetical protein
VFEVRARNFVVDHSSCIQVILINPLERGFNVFKCKHWQLLLTFKANVLAKSLIIEEWLRELLAPHTFGHVRKVRTEFAQVTNRLLVQCFENARFDLFVCEFFLVPFKSVMEGFAVCRCSSQDWNVFEPWLLVQVYLKHRGKKRLICNHLPIRSLFRVR